MIVKYGFVGGVCIFCFLNVVGGGGYVINGLVVWVYGKVGNLAGS